MEFRLVYQGRLPAAGRCETRSKEKHEIRKALRPQLSELWRRDPVLRAINEDISEGRTYVDRKADLYNRCGYRFWPLIGEYFGHSCSFEILFLRRDQPGSLIAHGGDIDNRIKVLLGRLRRILF